MGDDPIHDDVANFAWRFAIVKHRLWGDVNLTTIVAPQDSVLPPDLQQAYKETDYRVLPPAAMVLKIGRANDALLHVYAQHGVACAAYITACNPLSASLSDGENAARMAAFREALNAAGWIHFSGEGKHPDNNWPAEPSYLVLGLDREAAARVGCEQAQNAVVWCGEDGVPELLLLR